MTRALPLLVLVLGACPPASSAGDGRAERAGDLGPSLCQLAGAARIETLTSLATGRRAPSIALLPSHELLVAGGLDGAGTPLASAERVALLPPASVRDAGSLAGPRGAAASATTVAGLLLVGGLGPAGALRGLELHDPATGLSRTLGAMLQSGRESPSLTTLADGRLLIAGGRDAASLPPGIELYAPASETLQLLPATLREPRVHHVALRLAGCGAADGGARDAGRRDGVVRDAGARDGVARDAAGDRGASPDRGACPPETVLLAGGEGALGILDSLELVRGDGSLPRLLPARLPRPAAALAAAPLGDGRVLLAGGRNAVDGALAQSSLYDPASERLLPTAPLASARSGLSLTVLSDGRILAAGGLGAGGALRSLELYDPALGLWQTLPVQLSRARHDHVALLLPDCRVLIAGGSAGAGPGVQPDPPRELELITIPSPRPGDR